jgi:hypothetical protein
MLGPRHAHHDRFIYQPLIFQQLRTLRTGEDGDMRRRILNAKILEERRLHYDVAQIPILQYEDAFRLTGQFGSSTSHLINGVNERAEHGFHKMHKLSLTRTNLQQNSRGGGIRRLGI